MTVAVAWALYHLDMQSTPSPAPAGPMGDVLLLCLLSCLLLAISYLVV